MLTDEVYALCLREPLSKDSACATSFNELPFR